jgi:hypothetical protein
MQQQLQPFPFIKSLLMPLTVLRYGHIMLLLVTGLPLYLSYLAQNELYVLMRRSFLQAAFLFQLADKLSMAIDILASVLSITITAPLVLCSVTIPVQVIAMKGRVDVATYLKLLLPSFQQFLATLYLTLRTSAGLILIPITYYAARTQLAAKKMPTQQLLTYAALGIGVTIVILIESLPSLLAPLIPLCIGVTHREALQFRNAVFSPIRYRLGALIALPAIVCVMPELLIGTGYLAPIAPKYLIIWIMFWIWYTIVVVAGETVRRVDEINPEAYEPNRPQDG